MVKSFKSMTGRVDVPIALKSNLYSDNAEMIQGSKEGITSNTLQLARKERMSDASCRH